MSNVCQASLGALFGALPALRELTIDGMLANFFPHVGANKASGELIQSASLRTLRWRVSYFEASSHYDSSLFLLPLLGVLRAAPGLCELELEVTLGHALGRVLPAAVLLCPQLERIALRCELEEHATALLLSTDEWRDFVVRAGNVRELTVTGLARSGLF